MSENADETGPTHVPEGAREIFRDDDVIVYATADKRIIGYTRDVGRFEVLEAPELELVDWVGGEYARVMREELGLVPISDLGSP